MAYVTLTNITVLDNPTAFTNPFQFEVTFECAQALEDDLEWKITYVGSAEDESRDQVLEEVLVGPVPVGTNKFVFQSDPPKPDMIPDEDKVGVTVVLVTCSYRSREFVRVGYYVNNDYADPFFLENPPAQVDITKLQRNILADKPRVTRFPIDWTPSKNGDCPVGSDENCVGMNSEIRMDMDMDTVDDNELVKAAAQLDHSYTDIVIENDPNNALMEDLGEEDDEAEDDDEDDDQDQDEDIDDDMDLDLDPEVDSGGDFEE